ncbi:MAG: hypothetical protein S4CHLAM102_13140 [Chlamydiia bacterium]|nr:hypothetical protein [Chlamydiia bacterium]
MRFFIVLGRIFVSLIFIITSLALLSNWQITLTGLNGALELWWQNTSVGPEQPNFFHAMMTISPLLLGIAIALAFVGGVMVFFGFYPKLGAFFLLIFLIPVTIFYHSFWYYDGIDEGRQFLDFIKNVSIIGALLIIIGLVPYRERNTQND